MPSPDVDWRGQGGTHDAPTRPRAVGSPHSFVREKRVADGLGHNGSGNCDDIVRGNDFVSPRARTNRVRHSSSRRGYDFLGNCLGGW